MHSLRIRGIFVKCFCGLADFRYVLTASPYPEEALSKEQLRFLKELQPILSGFGFEMVGELGFWGCR